MDVRMDGRRLRSARTKRRIVEAYIALLREDPRIPTAAQVAEKAGYSVRSIFERFPDLHSLRLAATDHAFAQGVAQSAALDFEGDRETRIRNHVRGRSAICEHWLPLWRAVITNQRDSAPLQSRVMLMRQAILKRIELSYVAELSTLDSVDRRATLIAIEALIDFESWSRMRSYSALSVEEAQEVWIAAIDRLLPPTPIS